jgi:hypothetical protein
LNSTAERVVKILGNVTASAGTDDTVSRFNDDDDYFDEKPTTAQR